MLRTLFVSIALLAVIVVLLGVLSKDMLSEWGSKAADVTVKGARGGQVFLDSFKERLEEAKAKGEETAP